MPAKTSPIALRLALDETRAATVKELAAEYAKLRSIGAVAKLYDVSRRSLQRWCVEYPELQRAFEKATGRGFREKPAEPKPKRSREARP